MTTAKPRPEFDTPSAAKTLARRALQSGFIKEELARRLLDRLDLIRLTPQRVWLDAPASLEILAALQTRFPKAQFFCSAVSAKHAAQLKSAAPKNLSNLFALKQKIIVSQAAPQGDFDLIVSHLGLDWQAAPVSVMQNWATRLKAGGVVLFSSWGAVNAPSLHTAAISAGWQTPRAAPAIDMHDYGDMLVQARLATPVMDVERLRLNYARFASLREDFRGIVGNLHPNRLQGLVGKARFKRLENALNYPIQIELEAVFGHAFKPTPAVPKAQGISLADLKAQLPTQKK